MNGIGVKKAKDQKKAQLKKLKRVLLLSVIMCVIFSAVMAVTAHAADLTINVTSGDEAGNMGPLEIIFTLAFLALIPSIVLMMSCFTRIIIVLGFMRSAMGTNQSPPNMVLIGISIFLTIMIMMPVLQEMGEVGFNPMREGRLDFSEALTEAARPMKQFMLKQTDENTLSMFLEMSEVEIPQVEDISNPVELLDISIFIITPAFITSEISRAFFMGFLIYLPFLVIDMVVSSILMSMGMVMLPPAMISLPFKLLLFVMVDGWNLMFGVLVESFQKFM